MCVLSVTTNQSIVREFGIPVVQSHRVTRTQSSVIQIISGVPLILFNIFGCVSGCRGNLEVATDTVAIATLLVAWDKKLRWNGVEILFLVPRRFGKLERKRRT